VLLAAADLGTNSFHLVIARVAKEGGFEIITREREKVRLGHGGGDMKELADDAIDRGVATLARMRRLAESAGAPIRAVATSAVREAHNADVFLERARVEAGVEVEVISGFEEARLIRLGVLQAVPVYDKRHLLCDIGGGSTEIIVGQGDEMLTARSFKLGAVRLTDRFFPAGVIADGAIDECRAYVRSTLAVYEREVARKRYKVAVGSSGTFEALVRVAHAAGGIAELRTYNCQKLTRSALASVIDALLACPTADVRRKIAGLESERADIIVAGALILEGVYDAFGVRSMTFSEYALREGVLLDTLNRLSGTTMHHLRDVARRSVRHLADVCDPEPEHSQHVATLALQLFDATRRLHGLEPICRQHLEAGALLANVGLIISHDRHHLHSYYVIRNSEHLVGFTDHEIEIISQVARYHRKSAPKKSHTDFARLNNDDQRLVRTLAAILRVAIGLDRSHDGRVASLAVQRRDKQLTITLTPAASESADEPVDLSLELYAAAERRQLLEEVTGTSVAIVAHR
jgi:exopolyphosphatase / guanosine-5'-triphosphate,3'-diphosphate pyrophosphatase